MREDYGSVYVVPHYIKDFIRENFIAKYTLNTLDEKLLGMKKELVVEDGGATASFVNSERAQWNACLDSVLQEIRKVV